MGRLIASLISLSLMYLPMSVTDAHAATKGASIWRSCEILMNRSYNQHRGAKIMIGGYSNRLKRSRCWWKGNNRRGVFPPIQFEVDLRTTCKKAGYDLCYLWGVNGSLSKVALVSRNLAIAEREEARHRRAARERQRRQDNADIGAFVDAFSSAFGATTGAARSDPSAQPTYRPSPGFNSTPSGGRTPGGPVCTESQRARGWGEERCANN